MKKKLLLINFLIIFICSLFAEFPNINDKRWTKKYDQYFRKYSKRYWGATFKWKWFKAQAIAESNLKDDAKSWVGAKGIMQIMPKTFNELSKKKPLFKNINEPRWNIAAGIYYDKILFDKWSTERPLIEKLKFTFASYNGGFRNILKAQKAAEIGGLDTRFWQSLLIYAPQVKSWKHTETIGYVDKIVSIIPREENFSDFIKKLFSKTKDKTK